MALNAGLIVCLSRDKGTRAFSLVAQTLASQQKDLGVFDEPVGNSRDV